MIQISYIGRSESHSLQECLNSTLTAKYDTDILPFLKAYLNKERTVTVSTSGSTGKPKDILLEKEKMIASARATLDYFGLQPDQTILLSLPTKFIAGKMIWVRAIEGELNVLVAHPTSNPIKDLNTKVDFAAMTPHQVSTCLAENPEKFDLIDQLIIGGGAVNKALQEQLQRLKTKCYATYGMTETITHVAVQKLNGIGPNGNFKAIGDTTFKTGKENNLIISVPHLSMEEIVTNDIVELINSTNFKWLGRLDFVINSGGVKLFPEQIEKKLESSIDIPFFVWKETDEILGEKVILIVEGRLTTPQSWKALDKIEVPKKTYSLDEFEYTANGKLDRKGTVQRIIDASKI